MPTASLGGSPDVVIQRTRPVAPSALLRLVTTRYVVMMKTVDEIEDAIRKLPDEELAEFHAWFAEFDAAPWAAKSRGTSPKAGWTPWPTRHSASCERGVAPTCEPPSDPVVLVRPSSAARSRPIVDRSWSVRVCLHVRALAAEPGC
jgi:hypothetical protein